MASFNSPRFPRPMFKQNAPRPSFNMNFRGERPHMQPFQRVPNPSYRPFQSPDRFTPGNFQNRPRYSNFPDHRFSSGYRHPAPDKISPVNAPHSVLRPRFSAPFEPTFRPWSQRPTFAPPRQPFQNHPRAPVPPLKPRNPSFQVNKKRKQKTREFRKLKSWMTDELFAEVKKKNTLYLKAKSSDEQSAWQEFRLQRNRVSSLIKEAKIKAGLIGRKVKEDNNKEKPFSCDTCDRAFITENELDEHFSQHVKCGITNCKFEAHPKIVAAHQKMQHETGYADVINKLQDDEEIQKWREQRRKNFPTAENIQKRKAEQAEKEARGEVLETKEFGKFKRRRPEDGNLRNDHRRKRVRHFQNTRPGRENFQCHPFSRPFIFHINSESDSDSDSHITLKQFSGLSSLTNSANVNKESSGFEFRSSSFDNNTSNGHLSSWNQNEQNLPKSDSDKDLTVQNVLHVDSNVKDLDHTTVLLNDNSMERKSSEMFSNSLIAVEKITAVKDIKTDKKLPDNRNFTIAKDSQTSEKLLEISTETKVLADLEDSQTSEKLLETSAEIKVLADMEDSEDEAPTSIPIIKCTMNETSEEHNDINFQDVDKMKKITKSDKRGDEKSAISNGLNDVSCATNIKNKYPRKQPVNGDSSREYSNSQTNNHSYKWPNPLLMTRKSTLLEKLLANDIRHERNVILQCIRHIMNNNFFGIGQKK